MHFREHNLQGRRVVELVDDGSRLNNERDAVDIIGAASPYRAEIIVVPVQCLSDRFFDLKTRIAGEIVQKFLTYHLRLAIIGDISNYLRESSALRDFVYECNSGAHVWFVADIDELNRRLATG